MANFKNPFKGSLSVISFKTIQARITFLIVTILIVTIIVFLFGIIPFQRSASLDRMSNEAKDIANSISLITATAIISEDYSFAVDHCRTVIKNSESIEYILITKHDGFSLIHDKDGWTTDTLNGFWNPVELSNPILIFQKNNYSKGKEIFNYSTAFSYSGIYWGCVHIGLSLKKFDSANEAITKRSIIFATICLLLGFIIAYYSTKRIIHPIKILNEATKKVAEGDLTSRAIITTKDELQSLGDSFNKMTDSLSKSRNEIMANNDFINNIIKSLNDSLIVLNTSYQITKVNEFTTELTYFEEADLLGQSIDILLDEQSKIKFNENFKLLDFDNVVDLYYNDELNYKTKLEGSIPILFSISVILENDTKVVGYVAVARDIRARKQAEHELLKAHDELEQRVLDRTQDLELANSSLLSEITNRIQAEEKIKSSLQEKEVLLREIHHRVKNNLQVISSLLFLQSKKIEIQEYKDIFNESQNRIKSMALVHENLYKSDNLAGINLSDYIKALVNHLMRTYNVSYNKIKQEIHIENIILSIDKSIPLGLIINELVTNSLKYAFIGREEGIFKIEIKRFDSGNIKIIISDDGIGMPKDFDIKKSNSLGLRLVQTLVDQLEGTFIWNSNEGAEFTIEFNESLKPRK